MATSLTLENDSSLAQGYIKVNGSTAATLTTSGITGNLTGTASALQAGVKFPNFSLGASRLYNTLYQAATDGFLCVNVTGSFRNGIIVYVGTTSSLGITIWQNGDDLNSNTKFASSGLMAIPSGIFYQVAPVPLYDQFEAISINWYPII